MSLRNQFVFSAFLFAGILCDASGVQNPNGQFVCGRYSCIESLKSRNNDLLNCLDFEEKKYVAVVGPSEGYFQNRRYVNIFVKRECRCQYQTGVEHEVNFNGVRHWLDARWFGPDIPPWKLTLCEPGFLPNYQGVTRTEASGK